MPGSSTPPPYRRRPFMVAGIVLVAVNLRPALAAVGPVVSDIRSATGLPNAALGLLTTLPLLAFALISPLTSRVTRRVGIEWAMALALLLLGAGTLLRAAPSVALLYGGTALLGVGIALGNVLLPALAKRDFSRHLGPITSLYSSMMAVGATVAAGVSAPLALAVGWRATLGLWVAPVVVALLVWLPQLRRARPAPTGGGSGASLRALGRSRLAWKVALFMGLQSLSFYVILAWLPDLLQSRGMAAQEAGWLLALSQLTGVVGTALVPLWAGKVRDQRAIVWILGAGEAVGLAGLLLPGAPLAAFWVGLLGFVLGGTFGLALILLVERAPDAESAAELSGMAQAVGYLVAAVGPTVIGLLHDVAGGWTLPLATLFGVLAAKVASGVGAGRPGMVDAGA